MSPCLDQTRLSASVGYFIDDAYFHGLLQRNPDAAQVSDVIAKSLAKEPLAVEEAAVLLAAQEPALWEQILDAARQLKRNVYGNRIVLFAPLYVGNECTNDCQYCGFRRSNRTAIRRTLTDAELQAQVEALLRQGHKRLILVFGEHPSYTPEYIAQCVRTIYSLQVGPGRIRRVNINAAPLDLSLIHI